MELWLTSRQMGFATTRDTDEMDEPETGCLSQEVKRHLAPQISAFIRQQFGEDGESTLPSGLAEALQQLEAIWGVEQTPLGTTPKARRRMWEKASDPMSMLDPPRLDEVSLPARLGEGWFLNHPIPRPQTGRGFVRVWSEAQRWQESIGAYQVQVGEGLATSVHPEAPWTLMSAQWYFLQNKWQKSG